MGSTEPLVFSCERMEPETTRLASENKRNHLKLKTKTSQLGKTGIRGMERSRGVRWAAISIADVASNLRPWFVREVLK